LPVVSAFAEGGLPTTCSLGGIAIPAQCAILEDVRALVHLICRKGVRHAVGVTVCALLLFFAVGTKLAWYHPQEQAARSIAATKVCDVTKCVPSGAEHINIAPQSVALVVLLLSFVTVVAVSAERHMEVVFVPPRPGLSPFAVRPPPAC
jgi:hypothetical protein